LKRWHVFLSLILILAGAGCSVFTSRLVYLSHFPEGHFAIPSDLMCFRDNALLVIHPSAALLQVTTRMAPYMYPPPFLLLNAPLALLSPLTEFWTWTALSTALLMLAGRCAGISWRGIVLGLIMPANLYGTLIAESGAIVSSLLAISLALAETRPILAGIAAGALVIKPQFGLLLPICFLASRNFLAIAAAIAAAIGFCALTTLCFGAALWGQFFAVQIPLSGKVIAQAWPHPFWIIAVSSFFTLRSLGAGLHLAYAVQSIATFGALIATWRLWRAPATDRLGRLAATLCLAAIASPYVFTYDLAALSLILAGYAMTNKNRLFGPLAGFWFCSGFYIFISSVLSAGGILLPLLAARLWPKAGGTKMS
jgi:hypothetical protein